MKQGTRFLPPWALLILGAVLPSGCLERPIGTAAPQTTNLIVSRLTQNAVDKIDLLFMIDNSSSMADKQAILKLAVPVLVRRLVNPVCVTPEGAATQPATAEEPCPGDASREFPPLKDIHVGIITSSMGDAGANAECGLDATDPSSAEKVDNGRLLGSLPRGGAVAPGFLAWNGTGAEEFVKNFGVQLGSAGERGCGFEASMESWYHFLVDPTPWSSIETVDCNGEAAGSGRCRAPKIVQDDGTLGDPVVLAQRQQFLRPDSLVVVVMLTDENDCSIIAGGQYSLVAQTNVSMFQASPACAADPNDPCCFSCGSRPVPNGCEACADDPLPKEADPRNLRCLDQKRRFGVDFLYPTSRYVNALTKTTLCTTNLDLDPTTCRSDADLHPNPLLAGSATTQARDASLVFFAGIVGVPWQLIQAAQDEKGKPFPAEELHFKSSRQLDLSDVAGGPSGWDRIAGEASVRDVHMLESIASAAVGPRPSLPDSSAPLTDLISGHEFFAPDGDDLQYACTFPLPDGGRDCASSEFSEPGRGCDCKLAANSDYTENSPLCFDGQRFGSQQVSAKAYPGIRPLRALQEYGELTGNSIVASICARNVDSARATDQDFGYNPAVAAIVDRLKDKLSGSCLVRELDVEKIDGVGRGKPSCSIVEAAPQVEVSSGAACQCNPAEARTAPNPNAARVVRERLKTLGMCSATDPNCDQTCLCELMPAGGALTDFGGVIIPREGYAQYAECQTVENAEVNGWCYVDQNIPVITGDPTVEEAKNALVAACPAAEKRLLRFQGAGAPLKGGTTFVACRGASIVDAAAAPVQP